MYHMILHSARWTANAVLFLLNSELHSLKRSCRILGARMGSNRVYMILAVSIDADPGAE